MKVIKSKKFIRSIVDVIEAHRFAKHKNKDLDSDTEMDSDKDFFIQISDFEGITIDIYCADCSKCLLGLPINIV